MNNLKPVMCISWLTLNILAFHVSGQQPDPAPQEFSEKFNQARKASEELKRSYSWNSRTDVTKEGKLMDILIEEIDWGPDGNLRRRIINDQEAKLPSSFLIHQVAEEIKSKMISFMSNLHAFLQEYALDDVPRRNTFFSRAIFGVPDPGDQILISCSDVIVKGDKLLWWIDLHNYSITKASVSTTFDGDQIEFSGTYKFLDPGLNYLAFAEILVPAKGIMVQLHCYDYVKIR